MSLHCTLNFLFPRNKSLLKTDERKDKADVPCCVLLHKKSVSEDLRAKATDLATCFLCSHEIFLMFCILSSNLVERYKCCYCSHRNILPKGKDNL